jgi:hypothetical protein
MTVDSLNILRQKSKDYKKEVNKHARKSEKDFVHQLRNLKSSNPKLYWQLLSTKQSNSVKIDIGQLFDHFAKLSKSEDTDDDISGEFEENVTSDYDDNELNCKITELEIRNAIKGLKNGKSAGVDKICNEFIKHSVDKMIPLYMILFNKILDTGSIPSDWSTGLIVPIYKNKGDIMDTNNYRGITLISCVAKLFTSILNTRLTNFLQDNSVLHENQTGFRKGYSANDHIFLFKCIIDLFCFKKQKLFCAFIDYQKAFDTVWRAGLWYKLQKSGILKGSKVYNTITNLYEDIKSCVTVNGNRSELFACTVGVRQGENLSPLLFSLYINDLEEYLSNCGNAFVDFKEETCNEFLKLLVIMYADDTVIFSNTAEGLQKALNDLENYCKTWKLKVNSSKTKVTIFGTRKSKENIYNFTYGSEKIEVVHSFKYLGVLFNFNGNFMLNKKSLKSQSMKAMFAVLGKGRQFNLPIDIQLELFDRIILPILTYGCEVWGAGNNQILETVQLKFCKYMLGLKQSTPNCMVYGETGKLPIELAIKTRMISYWANIVQGNQNKLCHKMYSVILEMYNSNVYKCSWLVKIRSILDECGFSHIWFNQGNMDAKTIKLLVKQRLKDQFVQQWNSTINCTPKCSTYRSFKDSLELENYLVSLPTSVCKYILKFRLCNHKLAVETGRYASIDRHRRFCELCD